MKKFLFKGMALMVLALTLLIGFTACPGTSGGNTPAPTPLVDGFNRTTGEGVVGGKPFKMKGIPAANGATDTIGDDSTTYNKIHEVSLSAYMLGETEVTQELWEAVMGNNPSNYDGSAGKEAATGETQSKRPVETVNWYQAIAFCNKLSLKLGLEPCYTVTVSGSEIDFATLSLTDIPTILNTDWNGAILTLTKNGFRLPTESEWEWAAKGGKEHKWAGTHTASSLVNYAWYAANAENKTHEVKKRQPNGYGLYDMSGNVWEWCHDLYAPITTSTDLGQDYTGPLSGPTRVLRGGCYLNGDNGVSRSMRKPDNPTLKAGYLGLRLACRP